MEQPQVLQEYKGYTFAPCRGNSSGLYELSSKGELPDPLKGRFTSFTKAREQIDIWERMKTPRASKKVAI